MAMFFESEFLKRQNKAKVIHSKIPDLELLKFTSRGTSRKKEQDSHESETFYQRPCLFSRYVQKMEEFNIL